MDTCNLALPQPLLSLSLSPLTHYSSLFVSHLSAFLRRVFVSLLLNSLFHSLSPSVCFSVCLTLFIRLSICFFLFLLEELSGKQAYRHHVAARPAAGRSRRPRGRRGGTQWRPFMSQEEGKERRRGRRKQTQQWERCTAMVGMETEVSANAGLNATQPAMREEGGEEHERASRTRTEKM